MQNDIVRLSRRYLGGKHFEATDAGQPNPSSHSEKLRKIVELTSLYGHFHYYVSGTVVLFSPLAQSIGNEAEAAFADGLREFTSECRSQGIKPVLVTFATRFTKGMPIPYDHSLGLVRYNFYLSPPGWLDTISRLNDIQRVIAAEEGAMLIDAAPLMSGNAEYFRDFSHLTPNGHTRLATIIAAALAGDPMQREKSLGI